MPVIIKDNKPCKKIEFKVSNESAWEVGLACGGEIAVYIRASKLMKLKTLEEILKKKSSKTEFAILTNFKTGESEFYTWKKFSRRRVLKIHKGNRKIF